METVVALKIPSYRGRERLTPMVVPSDTSHIVRFAIYLVPQNFVSNVEAHRL